MLKADPHSGQLFVFRGKRGDLVKIIWHDGQGACLFSKKLERGRFISYEPSSTRNRRLNRSLQVGSQRLKFPTNTLVMSKTDGFWVLLQKKATESTCYLDRGNGNDVRDVQLK